MHYRTPKPGHEFLLGSDGQLYERPVTADRALMLTHGLGGMGQHPQNRKSAVEDDPKYAAYTAIPAFYPVAIELPGNSGAVAANGVPLRPELFVCKRITWATTADTPTFQSEPVFNGGSIQGRSVLVEWADEFTRFLGSRQTLVSALLGDSQGFLDLPAGILFQGKQTLSVSLTRLFWPSPASEPAVTRWDFVFSGLGLLPPGVNQSGSAS